MQLGGHSPLFMGREAEGKGKYLCFHQGKRGGKGKKKNEEVRKLLTFDKSF